MSLILVFDVVAALVAIILSLLSLKTLRAIRHLGTGKSFWIPLFATGILFFFASVVMVLNELNPSQIVYADEVVHASQLVGLCALICAVYSYSRRISKSLTEEFIIPERRVEERLEIEVPIQETVQEKSVDEPSVHERPKKESPPAEVVEMECKHQFGYLRTLRKEASIPDECLGCERIIECKHSLVDTLESRAA